MIDYLPTLQFSPEKCTDCKICELTCSASKEQGFNRHLARLQIERIDIDRVILRSCQLCTHPACVAACPWHAVELAGGLHVVVIDPDDCVGCRRCVEACPHHALVMPAGRRVPVVCDYCAGRPACVEVCPTGALTYGSLQAQSD